MARRLVMAELFGGLLLLASPSGARAAVEENAPPPAAAPALQSAGFSTDPLEQLVAPVALYPGPLLMRTTQTHGKGTH